MAVADAILSYPNLIVLNPFPSPAGLLYFLQSLRLTKLLTQVNKLPLQVRFPPILPRQLRQSLPYVWKISLRQLVTRPSFDSLVLVYMLVL